MDRYITTHKVNGVNDGIDILVADEKGAGGANHRYEITGFDTDTNPSSTSVGGYKTRFTKQAIIFQNGPIKEAGINGITQEILLAIVEDRLACFQAGPFASQYNADALDYVRKALASLKRRTEDRLARGVEGQTKV